MIKVRRRDTGSKVLVYRFTIDHLAKIIAYLDIQIAVSARPRGGLDLLVELLHKMAKAPGFKFDKVHINNAAYFPRGHGEIEDDQTAIRRGFRELLEMKRIIPMHITNLPAQAPAERLEDDASAAE